MKELGLNRITPSMLVEYENCPLLFYYRSWLGIKLPQTMMHLEFGTAIHNAIARLYETKQVKPGIDLFCEQFRLECIDEKLSQNERVYKYGEMLADGKSILEEFFAQMDIFTNVYGIVPKQFEVPYKLPLLSLKDNSPLEVPLSCRIDLECMNDDIVDYKTSAAPYDIFEARLSPQFLSYCWLKYQLTGRIPKIHIIVLIKKRKREKIQHLEIVYRLEDLITFEARVRSILEKIKNKEFKRPIMNHPRFCDCEKYIQALNYK